MRVGTVIFALADKCLEDSLAVPLCEQRVQPLFDAGRQGEQIGARARPPFVEHQPAGVRGQRCSAERTQPAERVAKHVDRGSGGLRDRVDHGGDILGTPMNSLIRTGAHPHR
jgi:hypothetical protein